MEVIVIRLNEKTAGLTFKGVKLILCDLTRLNKMEMATANSLNDV